MSLPPPEDLYREHAVVRRLLLIYSYFVGRIRSTAELTTGNVASADDSEAILKTARLFERFGGYHAASEEKYIFPLFRKTNMKSMVRGFIRDHREVSALTGEIITLARKRTLTQAQRYDLADLMNSVVALYRAHATHEDLAVIARLRELLTSQQLSRLSERMSEFERRRLGKHGFEDAMTTLGEIERPLCINTRALYE